MDIYKQLIKKYKWLLVLAAIFVIIFFSRHIILHAMGNYLIVNDKLEKADVAIVLGGELGERVEDAIRLYKQGYFNYLIVTGGPIAWQTTEAAIMKKQAILGGIPADKIIIEDKSLSTYKNAVDTKPIVTKYGFKKVILITSPYHTRRAAFIFRKVYRGLPIKLIVRAAEPNQYTSFVRTKWWKDYESRQRVLEEYLRVIFSRIYLIKKG
jgi:uncharacterized SAM-binding protein YcdF (DUF218 family)